MNRFWRFLNNQKRVIGGLLVVLFLILGTTLINLLQNKGIEASGSSSLTIEEGQGALKFDGIDDYVEAPHDISYKTPSVSVAFWAKLENKGSRHCLITTWLGYTTEVLADGTFKWGLNGLSGQYFGTHKINWDEWVFLVGTFDDTTKQQCIYINGTLSECQSPTGNINYGVSPLYFSGPWSRTKGLINDVRIYSYALSLSEVEELYNGQYTNDGGLVGQWSINEREGGTVYDLSGNNNNGTIHGAEWSSRWRGQMNGLVAQSSGLTIASEQVQGEITSPIYDLSSAGVSGGSQIIWEAETPLGKALEFNGVSDYVIGSSNLGISGDAEITMSTWIYWDDDSWSTNYPSAVGNDSTGTSNKGLSMTFQSGRPAIDFWNNRWHADNALGVKMWYHVAVTKTPGLIGSTSKIYVNGVEVSGKVEGLNTTPDIIDAPPVVGRLDETRWFKGKIDDVRIYNRALSEEEIQEIMNKETTGEEDDLVGYWKFNESSGDTAFDSSGNGNHGTIFGADRVNSIQSKIEVETNLSLNGGSTWQGWQSVTNGETIPGVISGANLGDARLQTRQTLATEQEGVNSVLGSLTMQIWGFGDPNVNGWAWSENIGWISFSNVAAGTEVPYGLHINPETMKLSGYIWSENIGWITFHRSVAGDPPSGNPCSEDPDCMAVLDPETFEISGWARALNYGDGWTGWISLAGTASDSSPYGVSIDPDSGIFDGWAWGSGLIGWISFNSDNEVPGTPEYYVYTTMDIGPKVDNLSHTWNYCLDTLHPILDWGVSKDSYGYFIEIYQDAGLSQLIYQYESGTTGATSHIPSYDAGTCHPGDDGYQNTGICNLEYGSNQYWWRIKARSAGDLYGAWSEPAAFIVENNHHWPEPDYIYDPDPVRAKQVSQFIDQSQPYGESEIESWYWTVDGIEGIDYNFVSAQRIPIVEGLAMHLDASMISGLEDGEKISQWDDMSGRGNHATNSDPATQPIFKEDPVSKKPMVGFAQNIDRSDPRHLDSVLSSNHDPNEGPSVFAVVLIPDNIPDGTRVGNVWGSYPTAPNYNLELHALGKTRWYWNQGEKDVYGSTDIRMGELAVISYHRDAVNGKLQTYINGVLDLDHDGAGTNTIYGQNWRLGRDYRSGSGIALIGNIAEFIVYERSLPSDEREAVEQYLMDKWLTEGDLEETGPESRNPYIMFRLEGEYDVTLEVTDSSGYGPCAITKRINVEEAADLEWREVSPTDE